MGYRPSPEQCAIIQAIARRVLSLRAEVDEVETRMREFCKSSDALRHLADAVGPAATIAIFADLGDPNAYGSAAALEKAAGLNLREKSSGTQKGRLHITKRGSGRVRRYLYLATIRMLLTKPIVRRWFERRGAFAPGTKHKAIVAVMRKLIRALFHVARGNRFDASKLFDCQRLDLASMDQPPEVRPVATALEAVCVFG